MPKILVADDNSNIQKMVALALKEQGIEVVGVGHGEAAVRKLPDVKPDLVLADVFMPVRNGYEVCEFVKNDQRFSHIPVVLLVGAFDPVDQHEVKRVRADGLLKKPFEPIDELMQMVRMMLEKSAQAQAGAPAAEKKPAGKPVGETVELTAAEMRELTKSKAAVPPEMSVAPQPEPEEFSTRPQRLDFGEAAAPASFSDLGETPGAVEEEEGEEEFDEEEEEAPASDFRASSVAEMQFHGEAPAATEPAPAAPEVPNYGGIETPPREPAPDEPPIPVTFDSGGELELVREDEPQSAPPVVESLPREELATADEFMAAASAAPPMATPIPSELEISSAPAATFPAARKPFDADETARFDAPLMPKIPAPPTSPSPPSPAATFSAPEPPAELMEAPEMEEAAFEPEPVAAAPAVPPPVEPPEKITHTDEMSPGYGGAVAAGGAVLAGAGAMAASFSSSSEAAPPPVYEPPPPPPMYVPAPVEMAPSTAGSPRRGIGTGDTDAFGRPRVDAELVDAVADKVIERLQGGILNQINREILRPIIEALIAREIDQKK